MSRDVLISMCEILQHNNAISTLANAILIKQYNFHNFYYHACLLLTKCQQSTPSLISITGEKLAMLIGNALKRKHTDTCAQPQKPISRREASQTVIEPPL